MSSLLAAATKQAPPRINKRKKKNTTAKRLRARKKARIAARAAATHTATVTSRTTAPQAVPEDEAVSETGRPACDAVPEGSMAQASAEAVSEGRESFPVAEGASMRDKKKRASRTTQQLASALIAALEDEEKASLALVATTPTYVTKAEEFNHVSICHTETTNVTYSDTDYVSSDTNDDSGSDSEMFWRIYDKNYERSKLTITANYVPTKETWQIARINDRRGDSLLEYTYQVLWNSPLVKKRRYYQWTWEPRSQLLADNFRKEIELVDRWKASKVKTFDHFWPTDEFGKNAIGADMEGLCIFHALKRAAQLTGRPDIVTRKDIDDFVEHQRTSRGEDLTKGTSWKVVLVFLRRLRDAGPDFICRAIALDNFAVPGRRGVRVLNKIKLKNGVYVVAAYSHQNVGHAFVLTVQGNDRLIYDLEEGKPAESAEDWIDLYAFVRPLIVCKQK